MYSTCLHCHASLGSNDRIEHFPVGRRLAFDAAKGRLWVVCPRCGRWNLTPLEERWEAIEECERSFRDTRQRVSTENVGLARLADRLELVRVGKPLLPELATWRYGRTLRRRTIIRQVGVFGPYVMAGLGVAAMATGIVPSLLALSPAAFAFQLSPMLFDRERGSRILAPGHRVLRLNASETANTCLEPADDGWRLRLDYWGFFNGRQPPLEGRDAERALRTIMTRVNADGDPEGALRSATDLIGELGGPASFLHRVARLSARRGWRGLGEFSPDVRLAVEVALGEDAERRAMEGELAALDAEWRLAEEIAAIADDLLIPGRVRHALASADRPSLRDRT